jgi:hypothetical protein
VAQLFGKRLQHLVGVIPAPIDKNMLTHETVRWRFLNPLDKYCPRRNNPYPGREASNKSTEATNAAHHRPRNNFQYFVGVLCVLTISRARQHFQVDSPHEKKTHGSKLHLLGNQLRIFDTVKVYHQYTVQNNLIFIKSYWGCVLESLRKVLRKKP